jgi:hypothetical protein
MPKRQHVTHPSPEEVASRQVRSIDPSSAHRGKDFRQGRGGGHQHNADPQSPQTGQFSNLIPIA